MAAETGLTIRPSTHLVHPRHVGPAAGVSLALGRVRRREVGEDGDLSVELVRSGGGVRGGGARHLEARQLVTSEAGLPVVTPLGQLLGYELARQDQVLEPGALTFLLGADQSLRIVTAQQTCQIR